MYRIGHRESLVSVSSNFIHIGKVTKFQYMGNVMLAHESFIVGQSSKSLNIISLHGIYEQVQQDLQQGAQPITKIMFREAVPLMQPSNQQPHQAAI
jgi:hypothetical protein